MDMKNFVKSKQGMTVIAIIVIVVVLLALLYSGAIKV
jgi:flagellar basal body-associated protein FliL